jgi:hypothetical protein
VRTTRDVAAQKDPARRPGESDRHFLSRLKQFACLRYAARLVLQGADAHVDAAQLLAGEFGVELVEAVPSDDHSAENSDSDSDTGEDLEGVSEEEDAEDKEFERESDADFINDDDEASGSDDDVGEAYTARRWPRLQPGGYQNCHWGLGEPLAYMSGDQPWAQ